MRTQRITIVMDEKNAKNLRLIQADLIRSSKKSVSFSNVVNQVLKCGLKSPPKKWKGK